MNCAFWYIRWAHKKLPNYPLLKNKSKIKTTTTTADQEQEKKNRTTIKDQEKKIEADLTNLKSETTTDQEQRKKIEKEEGDRGRKLVCGCSTIRAQYSGVWFERNTMVVGSNHPIFPIQALKGTFWSWMSSCMGVTDEVLRGKKKKKDSSVCGTFWTEEVVW